MKISLLCAILLGVSSFASASSVFTTRLDDPKAVYLTAQEFGAHGDGSGDDNAAIQSAIDKAEGSGREGIVFVPSGRYRLTHTLYLWPGVRLIGYGATRPTFVLVDNTPGFQTGVGVMVMFTGASPAAILRAGKRVPFLPPGTVPPNDNVADADEDTFYSAMSNIDFQIGDGNPAAIAIRFHVAQHALPQPHGLSISAQVWPRLPRSATKLRISISTAAVTASSPTKPHPHGNSHSSIRSLTANATPLSANMKSASPSSATRFRKCSGRHRHRSALLRRASGSKDCRFEQVSKAAVVISKEKSPLTEIGFENAVLSNVPTFALFRESGKSVPAKSAIYKVANFNYGLIVPGEGPTGTIGMIYDATALSALPAPLPSAIPALPPTSDWVNVHTLGVVGDETTDDTAAIQAAIATHRVLYFPSGHYRVTDTLNLKPDTVLIGLHPTLTQFDLEDSTPGFQGVGAPRPVISAPPSNSNVAGANIISGFGVYTGGINQRAVGVLWQAGESSLIDDIRFLGGHGTGFNPYNIDHTADSVPAKRWDGQYPEPLGDARRRRYIRRHLDSGHLRSGRILCFRHEDARPCL